MQGTTELRAPSPKIEDSDKTTERADHLDTQSKLLEITSHMDTTMHILHEKLGADGIGGGGQELDLQLDYQMSEGFPARCEWPTILVSCPCAPESNPTQRPQHASGPTLPFPSPSPSPPPASTRFAKS